ncbi:MAG: hypothetical protein H0U95_18665 [Bacteroidetes bacterium]|nr:hypothetical protein [Bacteroidota bacterium]
MKKISLIFGLFIYQFSFANVFELKEDSLKSEFDIKDPRNPNCPCHKYQKLADEEYKKFLGKNASISSAVAIKITADNDRNNFHNSFVGGSDINSNNKEVTKKFRSKKWTRSFFNFKKKKSSKRKKLRRLSRDNTTCFHF